MSPCAPDDKEEEDREEEDSFHTGQNSVSSWRSFETLGSRPHPAVPRARLCQIRGERGETKEHTVSTRDDKLACKCQKSARTAASGMG